MSSCPAARLNMFVWAPNPTLPLLHPTTRHFTTAACPVSCASLGKPTASYPTSAIPSDHECHPRSSATLHILVSLPQARRRKFLHPILRDPHGRWGGGLGRRGRRGHARHSTQQVVHYHLDLLPTLPYYMPFMLLATRMDLQPGQAQRRQPKSPAFLLNHTRS